VTELAQCYRAVIKNSKELKLRTSIERLAAFILRLHIRTQGNNQMILPIEKRKLASQLGMSAENLSRAFGALKPYGVTTKGNTIILTDKKALEGLAKPTRLIDDPAF
jgi:CRP/FNR family transcriptional activator FtrB